MPAYQFTALDASGKQHKGVLEGDSARQIRQQLRDKAWTPIAVDAVEQKDKHQQRSGFKKGFRDAAYAAKRTLSRITIWIAARQFTRLATRFFRRFIR